MAPTFAPATIVANAFVNRYYNILHQSPHVLHRFYMDESRLSRAEADPNASVDSAETLVGIHHKITSLDYGGMRAEIKTVDSQQSSSGSVLVMVTGSLFSASRGKRNFVQTFVLTPREKTHQEKSYYVLNDMFRYLDGEAKPCQPVANGNSEPSAGANTVSDQGFMESAVVKDIHSSEYSPCEIQEEVSLKDSFPQHAEVSDVGQGALFEDGEVPAAKLNELLEAGDELLEDGVKKSYASIPTSSATQAVQATSMRANHTLDQIEESAVLENEGDIRHVYVKNLPFNVTSAILEEEFSKFGQLKTGGVNLRNQKVGVCFAFIEFEEASSVQRATEASPITIGGRHVYVEEKRPVPFRGGRGRFNQGRSYQNDGMRGRGYFGRGTGRGGQESDKDFRGRGNGTGRGGGNFYTSNGNNANGYRQLEAQNGSGFRPARRGAGNQMGRNGPGASNGIAVAAA